MIIGCDLWNDNKEYNIQTNDPTEQLYKKLIAEMKKKYPNIHWGHLESCGVNAMTNCLAVTIAGRKIIQKMINTPGGYLQQFPHLLIGFLNDPANYAALNEARLKTGSTHIDFDKIQGNRVPQAYIVLAKKMLGIDAYFEWGKDIKKFKYLLSKKNPIQVCSINPSHYKTIKAYNGNGKFFYSDDSWPRAGVPGFNSKIHEYEFDNLENWFIWYDIK